MDTSIDLTELPSVSIAATDSLPSIPGIYFAMQQDTVLYVGQSKDIHQRWKRHHRHRELLQIEDVYIRWIPSDGRPLLDQESEWITFLRPPINRSIPSKIVSVEKVVYREKIVKETVERVVRVRVKEKVPVRLQIRVRDQKLDYPVFIALIIACASMQVSFFVLHSGPLGLLSTLIVTILLSFHAGRVYSVKEFQKKAAENEYIQVDKENDTY